MRTHLNWPMMKTVVLGLSLCLAVMAISPTLGHAIPVAGTYDFTSGFTGSFTSDGTKLTAWDFSFSGFEWTISLTGANVLFNNSTHFSQTIVASGASIDLGWDAGLASAPIIPGLNVGVFFTYAPHQSVPEPSGLVLLGLGLGLLGLVNFVRWQWSQAGVVE